MHRESPKGRVSIWVPGLGKLDGLEYSQRVRQFLGIPYARLKKRWTRAELCTLWEGNYHNGTLLGADCPMPMASEGPEGDYRNEFAPVPPFPYLNNPPIDEKQALVMNIVVPPPDVCQAEERHNKKLPVFVWVHGGSLMYGGANLATLDGVKLVAHSVAVGRPMIAINFNYRIGFGGFLASRAIERELARDGYAGCGNFGFTDQQLAFEWVQRYVGAFGGDPGRVTAAGESSGGISVGYLMLLQHPGQPLFKRAVCMSGVALSMPAWTLDAHEIQFRALCRHFAIDPDDGHVLDQLRSIPEQELANATPTVLGVPSGTGIPCRDGWLLQRDPGEPREAPAWLGSLMVGDAKDEDIIFHGNIFHDDYQFFRSTLREHIRNEDHVDEILKLYEIFPELSPDMLRSRVAYMAADAAFRLPNYITSKTNKRLADQNRLFLYHFDQPSRIKESAWQGLAHHALDMIYLFGNLDECLSNEERSMARDFARAWIEFVHGDAPWDSRELHWMIWGPDSKYTLKSVDEDEATRHYKRFEAMLNVGDPGSTWKKWFLGIDAIVCKRMNIGRNQAIAE
ncbi:putative acetylcholinesterase [Macrophomina phaseolina]|uniref:Acetylcholinesterase n=1 Tax=Macrophomina phaseolina TaxID=35725 RepID=A0ABQ8FQ23_9PEZI|nr:putative acetylcholinesterase [Macrophomina phaseolina]